jgi:hypothetical protein
MRLVVLFYSTMASDIYVQEPCETIGETEPLIVTQIIQDDYLFFDYYLNFGREHANKVCGGRVWPVVWLKGFFCTYAKFLYVSYRCNFI